MNLRERPKYVPYVADTYENLAFLVNKQPPRTIEPLDSLDHRLRAVDCD